MSIYFYLGLLSLIFTLFGYFLHAFGYDQTALRRLGTEVDRLRTKIGDLSSAPKQEQSAESHQALRSLEEQVRSLREDIERLEERVSALEEKTLHAEEEAQPAASGSADEFASREMELPETNAPIVLYPQESGASVQMRSAPPKPNHEALRQEALDSILRTLERIEQEIERLPADKQDAATWQS